MNPGILRLLRVVNDCKQQEIADILNMSQNTYSRLEGNPKTITVGQARKLAAFYKISLEDLLSDKTPEINFGNAKAIRQEGTTSEIASLVEERDFLRNQSKELLKLLGKKKGTIRKRK